MRQGSAEIATKNPADHLRAHRWQPGQSGNPAGYPKRFSELTALAVAKYPEALDRLMELMRSRDEEIALKAVTLLMVYCLGRPQEGRDLAHLESARARLSQLIAVQPVAAPTLTSAPGTGTPNAPLEQPLEAAREMTPPSVPSGLKCMYRLADGTACGAETTGQWCEPHKQKLFSMVNA